MRNLKIKTCTLLLLAAVACTKNQVPSEKSGFVSLSLTTDELVADMTRSNVSDYTSLPAASDFTISIVNSASEPVWSGKISEWDPTTALPSGNYGVTASYGSNETDGILVYKTMDFTYCGFPYWLSDEVLRMAKEIGFELADKYIYIDPKHRKIDRRRTRFTASVPAHAYFFVFRKLR